MIGIIAENEETWFVTFDMSAGVDGKRRASMLRALSHDLVCRLRVSSRLEAMSMWCSPVTTNLQEILGPIGVRERNSEQELGTRRPLVVLQPMRADMHAYAIVGNLGSAKYFDVTANAVTIAGFQPRIYTRSDKSTGKSTGNFSGKDDFR